MTEEELKVVEAMFNHGGGFVQALSKCFNRADDGNLAKLKAAFPEYWEEYKKIAEKHAKKDDES
mgnify:CR=1 FL=1